MFQSTTGAGRRLILKKILMSVFVAAALCMLANPAVAGTVRIGLMCPLTGGWASEGQDMRRIISLLADEANKTGGVKGSRIELVVEDDGGDPRTAALAAQKLAAAGVVAVIGTYGSAVTEASQNILDEAGILQIATGSTSVRLTEKGLPYFFRTCPRDDEQGLAAARVIQGLGHKNIAVLHDNSSYSRGLADETRALLDKAKLNIVFFDALTPMERDYSAILTRLRASSPDMVFFTGYYPEAGLLLRQKREMGWNVPMLGCDADNNPDLVKIAGTAAAAGFMFISPPVPADLSTDRGKAFLDAYRAAYKEMPQSVWAVLAGDAFNVLVEALRHAGADSAAAAAYLKTGIGGYAGMTGTFSFDAKGDRVGDLYRLYEVNPEGVFRAISE
ncbi:MAG: branched-chain amino acid ABC transporter substrate-binding protein [Desulfovibrio sp.]|jgi:branched-chain amino acid transport system substrate-binding protein|nr:branched-chain amino acid ABC transporter substrate-binding protein [Desulfovibrio sp.]